MALGLTFAANLVWPVSIGAAGLVVVWRDASDDEKRYLRDAVEQGNLPGLFERPTRRALVGRVVVGAVAVLIGLGGLVATRHPNGASLEALIWAAVIVLGLLVVFGPWWLALARDLAVERRERVRSQERADMAAAIHDSVLQTLALIQRSSTDPREVTRLARAQERELRAWLFDGRSPGSFDAAAVTTLAQGLAVIERDVEESHGAAVDSVVVGDCPLSDELRALLAAGREATVNAAAWSGADTVSLFAEVEPARVSLFVRDRGQGFDPAAVAEDRRGISESDPGPHDPPRRHGRHPQPPRRGHRGGARHAPVRRSAVSTPLRVFLVDDHRLFRAGVRTELGPEVEVVGEADEVAAAIELIGERRPDVVLVDVHMPDGGGQAVIEAVGRLHPDVRFLALSVSDAAEDVIGVIRAGARGYVTKTISGAELTAAIVRIADGDAVFSPRLAGFVLDAFAAEPSARPRAR